MTSQSTNIQKVLFRWRLFPVYLQWIAQNQKWGKRISHAAKKHYNTGTGQKSTSSWQVISMVISGLIYVCWKSSTWTASNGFLQLSTNPKPIAVTGIQWRDHQWWFQNGDKSCLSPLRSDGRCRIYKLYRYVSLCYLFIDSVKLLKVCIFQCVRLNGPINTRDHRWFHYLYLTDFHIMFSL